MTQVELWTNVDIPPSYGSMDVAITEEKYKVPVAFVFDKKIIQFFYPYQNQIACYYQGLSSITYKHDQSFMIGVSPKEWDMSELYDLFCKYIAENKEWNMDIVKAICTEMMAPTVIDWSPYFITESCILATPIRITKEEQNRHNSNCIVL